MALVLDYAGGLVCDRLCENCALDLEVRAEVENCPWVPIDDSGPVYIDCGCVAAGRPGLDVRGDVCPYCYGETRHELPF